ncbi:MAG: amidohydrolase family protein [Balneolaceae bacterium]|nr:amidohydrolase family protein [Balneolaceae bacterium]
MKKLLVFSLALLTGLLLVPGEASSQQQAQVFQGARIIPIAGEVIPSGTLVVQDGAIVAVGAEGSVSVPSGAQVHDMSGKVIMPGLVDTHSHIGEGDGGDGSASLHPDVRILDAIDPNSDSFYKALAGGITSVNVMPGSGHLMSGRTVYLKLRKSDTIEGMLFVDDPMTEVAGGLKMANGTNPLGGSGPGTRAKSAAMVRELFLQAQEYKRKKEAAESPEDMPTRDLGMETLLEVLNGERIVHNHTHRHDDILTAIRLSQEFGYRLVLQHVSEAWKVADEIAEAGVPASIITLDSPGGKLEAVDISYDNGPALENAGVLTAYHTDDGITDSRLFLRSAAFGVRAGMSRDKALEAMTIAGAKMMDIDRRTGTLEAGKDADFIVLSGDPLSVYTHVEQTWVEGVKRFDRSDPDQRGYATGGYDVFRGHVYSHGH